MPPFLHITSVPPGEAPLWVREKWVGLSLPLAQRKLSPRAFLTSGVVSGPKTFLTGLVALVTGKLERQTGFAVEAQPAIAALAKIDPEAAEWWRENVPHLTQPRRYFVFQQGVGHVIKSETAV